MKRLLLITSLILINVLPLVFVNAEALPVWLKVTDPATFDCLQKEGVTINARFGDIATVTVNGEEGLTRLRQNAGVVAVRRPQRVELHNNVALALSNASTLGQAGITFDNDTLQCTGHGVIVGVIDSGIDFNHINFKDKNGKSRVAAVYMPADSTGNSPVIGDDVLNGSAYFLPEEIELLTTDDPDMSHGTHTTGTAAGSYNANGYRGVAPGALLVLSSMPSDQLTDINIANAARFIVDYADKQNLPVVINVSLGSSDGAHDGSSFLCQVFDRLSGPGRIFVVSAGNQADIPCHWKHKFTSVSDSLRTFFYKVRAGNVYSGYASTWSSANDPHEVMLAIVDLETDTMCYRLPLSTLPLDEDGVATIDDKNDVTLAKYFMGTIYYQPSIAENERYNSIVDIDLEALDDAKYAIGFIYTAKPGETLEAWSSGICFSSREKKGWVYGTSSSTISDLATGKNTISVGAYCSTATTPRADGTQATYRRSTPGAIAYFSSYGPDATGRQLPVITAPGFALVSSASRYDKVSSIMSRHAFDVYSEGISYPYGAEYGTSMSTPVVTGAVALWLQADPTLTPDNILTVLANTSVRDQYVLASQSDRWGYGKLDVGEGLDYVINARYDVNEDKVVNVGDVARAYEVILSGLEWHKADVNRDSVINAGDISAIYTYILER